MPTSHIYYVCVCCLFMAAAASECGAGESCAAEEDVSALFQSSVETQGSQPSDVDEDGVKEELEEEEVGVGADLLEAEEEDDEEDRNAAEQDAIDQVVSGTRSDPQPKFTLYPANTVCKLTPLANENIRRRHGCMCRRRHGGVNKGGTHANADRSNRRREWTGWSCVGKQGSEFGKEGDTFVYNYNPITFRYNTFKMGDAWLAQCPPGYTAIGRNQPGGGTCEVCKGMAARRRGSSGGNPTCAQCPRGYTSLDGSDDCQHIQDTCDVKQCSSCKQCLEGAAKKIAPAIKECVDNSGAGCFNPGTEWCAGAQRGLFACQSKSLGCFFTFLCDSACICSAWKDVFCGGRVGNKPCILDLSSPALLEGNSTREVPVEAPKASLASLKQEQNEASSSLDESLSGKRPC